MKYEICDLVVLALQTCLILIVHFHDDLPR